MVQKDRPEPFSVKDKVIAVTGGSGILGSTIVCALAEAGANVAILDLKPQTEEKVTKRLQQSGSAFTFISCDVTDKISIEKALAAIRDRFGKVDALINGAGGNHPQATTSAELSFFELPTEALEWVTRLNFLGTVLPSQVFGKHFARRKTGNILNISSMNAFRPLTRIPAYSAAKAAVSNFTQWLAVHMAQEYAPEIRVNAIAPGFFLTNQNRFLLLDEQNHLTQRGQKIIDHTPMGRFGTPEDLIGTVLWLLSDASAFVTGIVVPVDGGFSAFSGV